MITDQKYFLEVTIVFPMTLSSYQYRGFWSKNSDVWFLSSSPSIYEELLDLKTLRSVACIDFMKGRGEKKGTLVHILAANRAI